MSLRLFIALLLALLASGCDRQKPAEPQGDAPASASLPDKGKLDRSNAGKSAPDTAFLDPDGEQVSLADFRGKPLLLNLWATWCAPCVAEMPTLDALAGKGGNLQVLAVSEDIEGQEQKVATFFEERKLANLEAFRDPELGLMTGLNASVLPTTILYDSQGKEVWRMVGAADWTGAETAKLLAEAR
ncbi:MAG TPA: TlpA disulfide reductase family protein [Allosphingosinicella sp.]|uniref:TlpA family protein disulfide reductase n=1 Tax=Allosphingosinicella sp. TaxID=2823234 RepID=UPI002EDA9992